MSNLNDLADMIHEDSELVPEIVAVDARLAIKITVRVLQRLLMRANAVIPVKEMIPGTAYARLDANLGGENTANYVRVTALDGTQTLTLLSDRVSVQVAGEILLPVKRVLDVLKLAPTEMLNVVVIGSAAIIRAGQAQWTIQLPTNPVFAVPGDETVKTAVPREPFYSALTAARRALPTFSARPALHQVLVEQGRVTAADGSRVHRITVKDMPTALSFAIPARGLDQVLSLLNDSDAETVEVGVTDTGVVFAIDASVLSLQRLAVPYPVVDPLLLNPAITNDRSLTIKPHDLLSVVRRVRLAADPEFSSVSLAVVPGKATGGETPFTLHVRAKDRQGNASVEKVSVQYSGPLTGQTVAVNHRFLIDLLGSLDSEFVVLRLGEDSKTTRRPIFVDDPATGFVAVLQQMRGDWSQ